MIAKVIRGRDFRGLHRYLTGPEKRLGADDVRLRNVCSISTAPAEMALNAARSTRIQRPVYHVILAWGEAENPSFAQQFGAAETLLSRIGLSSHQAVIVRHAEPKAGGAVPGDGRHHEIHIMVNRVGPDGRALRLAHDFTLIENVVATISASAGMAVVPGRHNGLGRGGAAVSSEAARSLSAVTGRLTIGAAIAADEAVMERLRRARAGGWASLLATFADLGVDVVEAARKARPGQRPGLVLVDRRDPKRREKISRLDSPSEKWGQRVLESALGPFPAVCLQTNKPRLALEPAPALSHPDPLWARFERERAAALVARRALRERHARERAAVTARRSRAMGTRAAVARMRRTLIRFFFGSRSLAARVVNHFLDESALGATRRAFDLERAAMASRFRAELEAAAVPSWADWRRAQRARSRAALHEAHAARAVGRLRVISRSRSRSRSRSPDG